MKNNRKLEKDNLIVLIQEAFKDVQLGNGISLRQTLVKDNYGGEDELKMARERDEKKDWRKVVKAPDLLNYCYVGGLCFYDKEGFRFHLPAYLTIAVIKPFEEIVNCLIVHLSSEHNFENFSILSTQQRLCVKKVLEFLIKYYDNKSIAIMGGEKELLKAISQFWNK